MNNKTKELMAEEITKYLKSCIYKTQEIIESKKIDTISFKEYIKKMALLKDKNEKYEIGQNFNILFSSNEIDEFASLVYESIINYSLSYDAYEGKFSFMIYDFLENYERKIEDNNLFDKKEKNSKLKLLNKWNNTYFGDNTYGIDPRIEGNFSIGYNDEFSIKDYNGKFAVKIGFNGTNEIKNREKKESDLLLSSNLYLGNIYVLDDESKLNKEEALLLRKNIDGKDYMKAIFKDGKTYSIENNKDNQEYAEPLVKLSDLFYCKKASFLVSELYTERSLKDSIKAYNKYLKLTDEEKEKLENVVHCACSWWNDLILKPIHESISSSIATKQKFIKCLGNELKIDLVNLGPSNKDYLNISTSNHGPNKCLSKAIKKSGLDGTLFSWGHTMNINFDKIIVGYYYSKPNYQIYNTEPKKSR